LGNKPLSPLVIAAVIVAAVLLFGLIGWKVVSGGQRGPNGDDLSRPAIPPPGMGGPPTSAK